MSTESAGRWPAHARREEQPPSGPTAVAGGPDESLEFVRFCYRRRRVPWPALYDEMCAVAARGAFRGLGYAELAEHGILFSLDRLPRLAALTEQVVREDRLLRELGRGEPVPMMLVQQQARS